MASTTEVWDDSALVNSWNEAFQEYKKYHSLAVKGEKVDIATEDLDDRMPNDENHGEPTPHAGVPAVEVNGAMGLNAATGPAAQRLATPLANLAPSAMPEALMASVQNEDMKNLMMSWYYAGYYTGLFEGKQQGYTLAQEQQTPG